MMRERVDGLIDDSPTDWTGVYVAKKSELSAIEAWSVGMSDARRRR